jgi:hypothetical protein
MSSDSAPSSVPSRNSDHPPPGVEGDPPGGVEGDPIPAGLFDFFCTWPAHVVSAGVAIYAAKAIWRAKWKPTCVALVALVTIWVAQFISFSLAHRMLVLPP